MLGLTVFPAAQINETGIRYDRAFRKVSLRAGAHFCSGRALTRWNLSLHRLQARKRFGLYLLRDLARRPIRTFRANRRVRGRRFCTGCGSRLFSVDDEEAEIKLGILSEAPTPLVPRYELWIKRREPWLRPVEGAEQHEEDRK